MSVFSNLTIQSTITSQLYENSFGNLIGFGMYISLNTTYYYVMDVGTSKVYIFNDEWSFISFKTITAPCNMISIGNSLYMTGVYNVWKVDKDLNFLINYQPNGNYPVYRGMSYNLSNGLLYVANSLK